MELEKYETELIHTRNQNEEILDELKRKDQELIDCKITNQNNINEIKQYYERELDKQ